MSIGNDLKNSRIVVVGSLNADLVQTVNRLPGPGETLAGGDLVVFPGGKGANQACAAGKLGGSAAMIGAVGDDSFGGLLLSSLKACNVDAASVSVKSGATGVATILVMPSGENAIVISPGANAYLNSDLVADGLRSARPGILLCQLEVPLIAIETALRVAREMGASSILDPAPAQTLSAELLAMVDILTPNQHEAAILLGQSQRSIESDEDAERAAKELLALGPAAVVLKMGAQGCFVASAQHCVKVPGFPVTAVDSTAAGDTFNGALAVALMEGKSLVDAAKFANAAAAISVTRPGAQSSIPGRAEVDEFLRT